MFGVGTQGLIELARCAIVEKNNLEFQKTTFYFFKMKTGQRKQQWESFVHTPNKQTIWHRRRRIASFGIGLNETFFCWESIRKHSLVFCHLIRPLGTDLAQQQASWEEASKSAHRSQDSSSTTIINTVIDNGFGMKPYGSGPYLSSVVELTRVVVRGEKNQDLGLRKEGNKTH